MFIFNNLYYNDFHHIKKGLDESFYFNKFTCKFSFGKCRY